MRKPIASFFLSLSTIFLVTSVHAQRSFDDIQYYHEQKSSNVQAEDTNVHIYVRLKSFMTRYNGRYFWFNAESKIQIKDNNQQVSKIGTETIEVIENHIYEPDETQSPTIKLKVKDKKISWTSSVYEKYNLLNVNFDYELNFLTHAQHVYQNVKLEPRLPVEDKKRPQLDNYVCKEYRVKNINGDTVVQYFGYTPYPVVIGYGEGSLTVSHAVYSSTYRSAIYSDYLYCAGLKSDKVVESAEFQVSIRPQDTVE